MSRAHPPLTDKEIRAIEREWSGGAATEKDLRLLATVSDLRERVSASEAARAGLREALDAVIEANRGDMIPMTAPSRWRWAIDMCRAALAKDREVG